MGKKEIKKTLALVVEPLALGLVALLFIIPAITVVNLQPITKKLKELNVLGVTNTEGLKVNIVGGTHQIFFNEMIEADDGIYLYKTKLVKRNADSYSKPILEIVNTKGENINLQIYGGTLIPTKSEIGVIIKDQKYRLQGTEGNIETQNISIPAKEKYIVYLYVENFSDIQFEEDFELTIKEIQ
ncbi:MAG: hypothetical protein ACOX0X_01430 [Candidatus Dojkabacteria bacterium]